MHDTAFAPQRLHSTRRVSLSEAQILISEFLEKSESAPYLHPNALITDQGPVLPFNGQDGGVVMQNLRRIEAGLRGEQLAADDIIHEPMVNGTKAVAIEPDVTTGRDEKDDTAMNQDWQNLSEYEQEQEDVETGFDSTVVSAGKITEAEKRSVLNFYNTEDKISEDKPQRNAEKKAQKKARKKQQKQEREEGRKRAKDAVED